ncbi:dihydrodipicolinate synthase family protein [Herbiconiux sp.]|uniref:dihydrodipicolinate synthase family protein n=1 Tax=Herbiconiux sp. TaxID=1871186 RepID=UPI0025C3A5EA|nr:dihydrodipicolinate synthase family protein [Herbiconiux sp.]
MTRYRNGSLEPGVWGVLATPFLGSALDVDTDAVANLAVFYDRIGATGLTVLGVFGEAAGLSSAERADVIETVVESSALPLVIGLTSLYTRPAIQEAAEAVSAAGARLAAVMVQIPSADTNVVIDHLTALHSAVGVPIVLQDYPVASGVSTTAEAIAAIVRSCPFVCAVKSESPPTAVAVGLLDARVDVPVFGGLGGLGLLDELQAGAAGAMTGFSYPEALISCVDAWRTGGFPAAREALMPFLPLITFEQQPRIALAIRKEVLRRRGLIAESGVRSPAAGFPDGLDALLAAHLHAIEQSGSVRPATLIGDR